MQLLDRLEDTVRNVYERLNEASGGALGIVKETIRRYGEKDASKWAASLAYYIFFSLFPLLLVMVALATYVLNLNSDQASREAVRVITEAVPVGRSLVSETLDSVVELRGAVTLVSLIGLTWSASGAFATLSHTINAAFRMAEPRGFIKQRLVALAMMLGIIILLLLSLLVSTLLDLLPEGDVLGLDLGFLMSSLGIVIRRLAPLLISFVVFIVLYRWVPTEHVMWKAILWGAGVAAVGWELAKWLFTWYIQSGMSVYGVVYGSLASVVILLFWIYISSSIVLFGAHLAAVIDPEVKTVADDSRTEYRDIRKWWRKDRAMNQNRDEQKRALIILNPVSGTKDAGEAQRHIEEAMTRAGWAYKIVETREDIEIADLTRQASPETYDLVVAAGGDGTVAGVASTLVNTGAPLGIVPHGTGNALARDLGIPLDSQQAAWLLTGPHGAKELNVLQVGEAYYLLNVSAGISGATMKGTERSAKQDYGMIAYVLDALKQISTARPVDYTIEIDGETLETRATEVAVINSGLVNSEILSRYANMGIDKTDVVLIVVQAETVPDYIAAAWDVLAKRMEDNPRIRSMAVHDYVTIRPHEEVVIQADGEPLDLEEVTVRIIPNGIRILVSA